MMDRKTLLEWTHRTAARARQGSIQAVCTFAAVMDGLSENAAQRVARLLNQAAKAVEDAYYLGDDNADAAAQLVGAALELMEGGRNA